MKLINSILHPIFATLTLFMSTIILANNNIYNTEGSIEYSYVKGANHYGKLHLLTPLASSENSILFVDFQGFINSKKNTEINAGLGYRKIYKDIIIGGYSYIDYRAISYTNNNLLSLFAQTIGVEILFENIEFRVNGYIPISNSKEFGSNDSNSRYDASTNITTYTIDSSKQRLEGLYGADVEVGGSINDNLNLFIRFAYFHKNKFKTKRFIHARSSFKLYEKDSFKIQTNGEITYNPLDKNSFSIGLEICWSNNKKNQLSKLEKKMISKPIRDLNIEYGINQTSAVQGESKKLNGLYVGRPGTETFTYLTNHPEQVVNGLIVFNPDTNKFEDKPLLTFDEVAQNITRNLDVNRLDINQLGIQNALDNYYNDLQIIIGNGADGNNPQNVHQTDPIHRNFYPHLHSALTSRYGEINSQQNMSTLIHWYKLALINEQHNDEKYATQALEGIITDYNDFLHGSGSRVMLDNINTIDAITEVTILSNTDNPTNNEAFLTLLGQIVEENGPCLPGRLNRVLFHTRFLDTTQRN